MRKARIIILIAFVHVLHKQIFYIVDSQDFCGAGRPFHRSNSSSALLFCWTCSKYGILTSFFLFFALPLLQESTWYLLAFIVPQQRELWGQHRHNYMWTGYEDISLSPYFSSAPFQSLHLHSKQKIKWCQRVPSWFHSKNCYRASSQATVSSPGKTILCLPGDSVTFTGNLMESAVAGIRLEAVHRHLPPSRGKSLKHLRHEQKHLALLKLLQWSKLSWLPLVQLMPEVIFLAVEMASSHLQRFPPEETL